MCQSNNIYDPEDATRKFAYKVMYQRGNMLESRYENNRPYRLGVPYIAKRTSRNFLAMDILEGGVFHTYPDKHTALRALYSAKDFDNYFSRTVAVLVRVLVDEYVASGCNGATRTACYRRVQFDKVLKD